MGKYDLTNQLTPIQSTFVDPGVAAFKEAAGIYRKSYDQNKDAYNLSKRVTAQMELMPNDESLRGQFTGNIDQTFQDIISNGNFEDAELAVQNAVEYITTDNTVLTSRKNYAEYAKEEALLEQFGPSGVLDFNKNRRETFQTVTEDENGNPVVNSYKENMEQKENYFNQMKLMSDGISPSGNTWAEELGPMIKYGNWKGVTNAKIEKIVNGLYDAYKSDKIGDQDFRRLTQIEGMSEQQAKEDIIERFMGAAAGQEGVVRTISGMTANPTNSANITPIDVPLSPLNKYLQQGGKYEMPFDEYLAMHGGEGNEGRVPRSVNYKQDGIVFDYTKQMNDGQKAEISRFLMDNDLAVDEESALELVAPVLKFNQLYKANKHDEALEVAIELGYMNRNDGFDVDKANDIERLGTTLSTFTNTAALANMGSFLDVTDVSGDFIPNTGTNTQTIGASFVTEGMLRFNKDEMNEIANQMDWGTVGSALGWDVDMLPGTSVDIENKVGLDGKPLFVEREDEDGNPFWYTSATYKTDFNTSKESAVYNVRNTESNYGKNDGELAKSSGQVVAMKALRVDKSAMFSNRISKANLPKTAVAKSVYKQFAEDLISVTTANGGNSNDYLQLLTNLEATILTTLQSNKAATKEELKSEIFRSIPLLRR